MNAQQGPTKPIPMESRNRASAHLILPQAERRVAVPDGPTVLSAAPKAGIPYPHSCTSGRCGTCKSNLMGCLRNFTFFPVLSRVGSSEWRTGYVSAAVAEDHGELTRAKAYLAGPSGMVDGSLAVLIDRGASARDVHADVFFTPEENPIELEQT